MPEDHFPFAFTAAYRLPALLFGVMPATTGVVVDDERLQIRFGPWRLTSSRTNVAGCTQTGDFSYLRTAGPARLSLADRGITFATNADHAVCIRFRLPVHAIEPTGRMLHPAATVTVADPPALVAVLDDGGRH